MKTCLKAFLALIIALALPARIQALTFQDVAKRAPAALLTCYCGIKTYSWYSDAQNCKQQLQDPTQSQNKDVYTGGLKSAQTMMYSCLGLAGLCGYLTYNPTSYWLARKAPGALATLLGTFWTIESIVNKGEADFFAPLLVLSGIYATQLA